MKRIADPVETTEQCSYGCGQVARFKNGSGKLMCCERHNSCIANKAKNSAALKDKHAEVKAKTGKGGFYSYQDLPKETKTRMNWNKGKSFVEFGYGKKGNFKFALVLERGHMCECCNNTEWLDKPITLELEHVDADRNNNTKENLKLLCPNCHSQTPTWRRGAEYTGFKKRKYDDQTMIDAITTSENLNQVLSKLDLRYGSVSTIVDVMIKHKVNFCGNGGIGSTRMP